MNTLNFKLITNKLEQINETISYFINNDNINFKIGNTLYRYNLIDDILFKTDDSLSLTIDPNNNIIYIVMFMLIVFIVVILFILINNHSSGFNFKTLSSNCDDFEVSGSAAYNKDKTSIYISDVNYCGEKNDTIYKSIECNLYETYNNVTTKISSCNNSGNKTLSEFLDDVKINVDNYLSSCKEFSTSKLYLEINAVDKNNKNTYYKIPIVLKDNCSNN